MSMKKRRATRQEELFVPTSALPDAPGHPFYSKLNELLATHCFDAFVEERCASYYAKTLGRPSIEPGVYFRVLMIGYFEGLGSEHGIDWRVADSLALRSIVRRDTGEGYDDYLDGLAKAEGIETPTRQELAKLDKKRPNDDWQPPHDPDARIAKMKKRRQHPLGP